MRGSRPLAAPPHQVTAARLAARTGRFSARQSSGQVRVQGSFSPVPWRSAPSSKTLPTMAPSTTVMKAEVSRSRSMSLGAWPRSIASLVADARAPDDVVLLVDGGQAWFARRRAPEVERGGRTGLRLEVVGQHHFQRDSQPIEAGRSALGGGLHAIERLVPSPAKSEGDQFLLVAEIVRQEPVVVPSSTAMSRSSLSIPARSMTRQAHVGDVLPALGVIDQTRHEISLSIPPPSATASFSPGAFEDHTGVSRPLDRKSACSIAAGIL